MKNNAIKPFLSRVRQFDKPKITVQKCIRLFQRLGVEFEYIASRFLPPLHYDSRKSDILILGSAHKVGSTWLFNLISDLGGFIKASPPKRLNETGTLVLDSDILPNYLRFISGRRLFKSHSYPPASLRNDNLKFITIFRDPRDVIISNIFYLSHLDPDKGGWGKDFSKLDETQRILKFINNAEFSISLLEAWFKYHNAYKVRYEDMLRDPREAMRVLFEWLNVPVSQEKIQSAVAKNCFEAKSKRKPGVEDKGSFYRKGISGDWKNYFDRECITLFKTAMGGRWNRLLLEMGYESSEDWVI